MKLDAADLARTKAIFALLKKEPSNSFPEPKSLATSLAKLIPADEAPVLLTPQLARGFATAAVDAWLRAVHSFLVSAALTGSSPIWSSVAGYYSSHYVMRATSHVLGTFILFKAKRVAKLTLEDGKYYCTFNKKTGDGREHTAYWKTVKSVAPFSKNALFVLNNENTDTGHRELANYADHLAKHYFEFNPISALETKERVDKISKISFSVPPIPSAKQFPDLESVQIVAYHRIVSFRRLLDEALPTDDRFWTANRKPPFASKFLSYQLVEQAGLGDLDV